MKIKLGAGTLLAPVPAVLVSCGDGETSNLFTAAWTGIINTKPPMLYVSIRKTRHSHGIISRTGEFAVNLTTADMVRSVDLCGVKSGRDGDKFSLAGFHRAEASEISAPIVEESPLSLECRVREIRELGSHDMFIADIICADADGSILCGNGKIDLKKAGLMAYSHGEYFSLGKRLGSFGYSVAKKHRHRHGGRKKQ